jgi:soluble lytic murein transglycosylase-like protein
VRRALHIVAMLAGTMVLSPASAQVVEIDTQGRAITYDRPMLFVGSSVVPLPTHPADPARAPMRKDVFQDAAREHGLSPTLLAAVAWQESRWRRDAVSPKGAIGMMQLMPATARRIGVDPFDPAENLRGGAYYLRQQIDRFGSVPLALAAYNAGPGSVLRYGGIPPYRETRSYVSSILAKLGSANAPDAGGSLIQTPLLIEVAAP